MKAKFFFLGLCALALAACSIDEVSQVNDTNAVKFKATTATRATATTTNNLTEFSVWAWNTDTYGVTNEFMDDVIATKGSNGVFTTSPLYFWPTGTVDFYALTPATEVCGVEDGVEYAYLGGKLDPDHEKTEDGTPWVYTGNVAKAQINNGKIVIDTYVPSFAEEQIDLCYAVTTNQSSGSVAMNFRHALSQVAFKVTNSNPEFVVDIKDISLCSVYKEGTFTISGVDTDTNLPTADTGISDEVAATQGTWVVNETDEYEEQLKGRFVPGITPTVLNGTEDGTVDLTTDPLMLIPQTVEMWDVYTDVQDEGLGSYIRINCHVTEDGSQLWPNVNEEVDGELPYYAEIAVPAPAEWEQGYCYTYTLIFGEGIGYYPPDDPNTELDGTPILVPITFTVTVDEFQDAVATEEGQYDVSTNTEADDILPYLIDENFCAYVAANFDTDADGCVSHNEAAAVTSIKCGSYPNEEASNYEVSDFTGIEYFTALTSFESNTAETLDLSKNTELTTLYLGHRNVSANPDNASPITTLDLSKNTKITTLQQYAFRACDKLTSIVLPSSATTIGNYCFSNCTALTTVDFASVTTINQYAFQYCSVLTNVAFPETLTTIGYDAFQYCLALSFVDDKIPDTVTSVDTGAFQYGGLEAVIWTSGTAELPRFAFRETSLVNVTLPETVTSISTNAFNKCTLLESMTIYATTPPQIMSGAFTNAVKFVLYVPEESIEAYEESSWADYCSEICAIEE